MFPLCKFIILLYLVLYLLLKQRFDEVEVNRFRLTVTNLHQRCVYPFLPNLVLLHFRPYCPPSSTTLRLVFIVNTRKPEDTNSHTLSLHLVLYFVF